MIEKIINWSKETLSPALLQEQFDAIIMAGGAEQARELSVPGHELTGVH